MSNNIAEGSGSYSNKEFAHYLNIAHRSVFENANILVVLERRKLISDIELIYYMEELDKLARKLTNLRKYKIESSLMLSRATLFANPQTLKRHSHEYRQTRI